MHLKQIKNYHPPFFIWKSSAIKTVITDSEFDLPIVVGNDLVCQKFLEKYAPADATLYYYNKSSWQSFHHLSFAWIGTYEPVEKAAEAESEEKKSLPQEPS